jgi:hypothetical protein
MLEILLGVFVIHLRKTKPGDLKGWQSLTAIGLGIAALALPWYVVMRS